MHTSSETKKAADATEDKHSFSWTGFVVWPLVILVLYVLSLGPYAMMVEKGRVELSKGFFPGFYAPMNWAYLNTPLHKPIGMYLHLWSPSFDENGELAPL